ncbi:unnamed protein product [Linum tenue]|uniref:Cucumisin n=1 Tax=Linum tenue TaxID=586396 RepID=A0AAV0MM92_9ROSI|nr:unnamed protein product [Linum tenue]
MGHKPNTETPASALHLSLLQQITGSASVSSDSLVYSYKRSFNGFAARLTDAEKDKLSGYEGIASVFPNRIRKLHTTRSWDFLGFPQNVKRATVESDIIIGMLDTGVWPESQSFDDSGYGPPPQKWEGVCQSSSNFTCNNKIVGARIYRSAGKLTSNKDVMSPRDTQGHGSHTASTAAGNFVAKASMEGLGKGTARGGVPSARIAVYKICWSEGCYDADVLAAFDDAISDGVDIISISIGGTKAYDYFTDATAIGSYHAMKHGILTSVSAGNEGPELGTVTNVAPWLLSVAAITVDRKFVTKVKLGNGRVFKGTSINTFDHGGKMYPVVYGGNAPNSTGGFNASMSKDCSSNTLSKKRVKGRIVLCDSVNSGEGPAAAGAAGSIMLAQEQQLVASNFPLPASTVSGSDEISRYVMEKRNPTATIFRTVEKKSEASRIVPWFSSRGPNAITPNILKPDIAAPGVDILAAYSRGKTVTGIEGDKRVVSYNILSGTSMACPHATGAAALVKSFHPNWSPAALRSALMTTASPVSRDQNPDAEFAYGAGLINLKKAANPGLIYDAREHDYVEFLCGQGYNATEIKLVTSKAVDCSDVGKKIHAWNLNYPSFTLSGKPEGTVKRVFRRTVTNVGKGHSKYKAKVISSKELKIKVNPKVLRFKDVGETISFRVTVKAKLKQSGIISGVLVWSDGSHKVRSPVVAHTLQ